MGKTVTPKYRLQYLEEYTRYNGEKGDTLFYESWKGKVTQKRLIQWVESFEKSTKEGGVNAHVGPRIILEARIVEQKTGNTVLEFKK